MFEYTALKHLKYNPMNKVITCLGFFLLALTACNDNTTKNGTAITTEPSANASSGLNYNTSDLKNVALAINATAKPELQQAIDSIQDMDLKYWAIAATIKTDNGLIEAIQKIKNKDVKSIAFAMSGNDSAQGQQMIQTMQDADLKNVALASTCKNNTGQQDAIGKIENAKLKNFASAITAATAEERNKYVNAIGN